MESIIVGEGEIGSIAQADVVRGIESSESFSLLVQHWRQFCHNLDINNVTLVGMEQSLTRGVPLSELPQAAIQFWKAEKGKQATLSKICEALETMGLRAVAEDLLSFIGPKLLSKIKFEWNECQFTLEKLLKDYLDEKKFKMLQDEVLKLFPVKSTKLLKSHLSPPVPPKYFIDRNLMSRSRVLDPKIFSDETVQKHRFVVKGISKPELVKATGYQPVDIYENQLQKITVRFILWECDGDFDRVCKITTDPVHQIHFKNDLIYWEKSSKCLDDVHKFLRSDEVQIPLDEIVSKISTSRTPFSLCISDSPGIGKTTLLAHLARKVKNANPTNVVLFIELHDFVKELAQIDSVSSAVRTIVQYAASAKVTAIVLEEMIRSSAYKLYLFLDRYDEISQDKVNVLDSFIRQIVNLQNVRVIITTRYHLKSRLEVIFNRLSYGIAPLDKGSQIKLLKGYWVHQHAAKNNTFLIDFANKCQTALQKNLSGIEEIAKVPLQCRILAEVHADLAKRSSEIQKKSDAEFSNTSFFDMYQKLVDIKFTQADLEPCRSSMDQLSQKYKDVHVYAAIELLFKDWSKKFSDLNRQNEIDISKLYLIGILELSENSNASNFMHQTFAEFLLAEFIVKSLKERSSSIDLFFQEIFGKNGVHKIKTIDRPTVYKLRHYAIAYFIEMHLEYYCKQNSCSMSGIIPFEYFQSGEYNGEDVLLAIVSSCCADLENCFDIARAAFHHIRQEIRLELKDRYFKHLPHLIVENSNNDVFLKKVLDSLNFRDELNYYVCDMTFGYLMIFNSSPIHVAVKLGKFKIVKYFLEEYGDHMKCIDTLMHVCVDDSAEDKKSLIEDKLSIIDILLKHNRCLLEQRYEDCPPILRRRVHLDLLKHLIDHGADINAYSTVHGTILHTNYDKNNYSELVRWAFANNFKLVNNKDRFGDTPVMYCGAESKELLKLFKNAGADFNAQDQSGNSVLFRILSNADDVEDIRAVLDSRANVNHTNEDKENAAHFTLRYIKTSNVIKVLELLKSYGFNLMNKCDYDGKSLVEYAKEYLQDNTIIEYVIDLEK